MEPFRFHFFVCTQQKPEGTASCPASGSFTVLDALDREIQARGLDNDVQLTTCGCMGLCDEGPVMVVYPKSSARICATVRPSIVSYGTTPWR
jgi:NADH:ubiquinone oxidoreductase subunit E